MNSQPLTMLKVFRSVISPQFIFRACSLWGVKGEVVGFDCSPLHQSLVESSAGSSRGKNTHFSGGKGTPAMDAVTWGWNRAGVLCYLPSLAWKMGPSYSPYALPPSLKRSLSEPPQLSCPSPTLQGSSFRTPGGNRLEERNNKPRIKSLFCFNTSNSGGVGFGVWFLYLGRYRIGTEAWCDPYCWVQSAPYGWVVIFVCVFTSVRNASVPCVECCCAPSCDRILLSGGVYISFSSLLHIYRARILLRFILIAIS